MPKQAPEAFTKWLNGEMSNRHWSIRETAQRAGISHTPVAYAATGELPSPKTCKALARAFGVSELEVLALAGHIKTKGDLDGKTSTLVEQFQSLSDDDQDTILALARTLYHRARQGTSNAAKTRKTA